MTTKLFIVLTILVAIILTGCFRAETPEPPVIPDTSAEMTAKSDTDTAPETDPPETDAPATETPAETEPPASETVPPEETDTPEPFSVETIDGCTYIDGVLVVNKTYPLPETYAPGMNEEAFDRLCRMFSDAKALGYPLKVASSYRSYYDQRYIYNGYVAANGQTAADRFSARPGHSEHQSGLAFDLNHPDSNMLLQSFGDSPVGIWIAENCHKYGFIIRYPKDKEHLTGYMYEPWHVRYLGVEMATKVYESGLCLEEFFGITSAYAE